jgi:hypothetical protein
MIGKTFGNLTVLEIHKIQTEGKEFPFKIVSRQKAICKCSCGGSASVWVEHLKSGNTVRCLFCRSKERQKERRLNLLGKRFGKLVVQSLGNVKKHIQRNSSPQKVRNIWYWNCRCDCGKEKEVIGWHLNRGLVTSCGCTPREGFEDRHFLKIFAGYKHSAKVRRLSFRLSFKVFKKLITSKCEYCGSIGRTREKVSELSNILVTRNGIDRVNNSKGYVSGNVVSCCSMCNFAKAKHSKEEMVSWAKELIAFQNLSS